MNKSKDTYCDRCGKLVHEFSVKVCDAVLCGECVAYLEELAEERRQALVAAREQAQKECKG